MKSYLDLLRHILAHGETKDDRTNTGSRSVFGYQLRHHMPSGFPLLTTKKVHIRSIIHELLWFLRGETNIRSLQDAGVTIWDEWADENGDLGPVYGHQWRHFCGIDQIRTLLNDIAENPYSRRHIVSAWNPADVPFMALPPCHVLWQCNVSKGHIDLHMYQRSADSFLGVPFNIASYAFLLAMIGHVTGLKPRDLIISYGDLHIYSNHMEQVAQQLSRWPRKLPTLHFARQVESIDDFRFEDFVLSGYDPHPAIKAPVAV